MAVSEQLRRERYNAGHYRVSAKKRAILNKLKDVPCTDCGNRFPSCAMDFDHRPGTTKLFNVTEVHAHGLNTLLAEIAKCDVVCANCHRIRTYVTRKRQQ